MADRKPKFYSNKEDAQKQADLLNAKKLKTKKFEIRELFGEWLIMILPKNR